MCDWGWFWTQPWWRPYSVAWIVITSGQRKRFARWSPATATSQSCPCTTSNAKRSPSSTPAASMSAFMCSTQVHECVHVLGERGLPDAVDHHPMAHFLGGQAPAPARQHVDLDSLADEVLGQLSHVAPETTLDHRGVLP